MKNRLNRSSALDCLKIIFAHFRCEFDALKKSFMPSRKADLQRVKCRLR